MTARLARLALAALLMGVVGGVSAGRSVHACSCGSAPLVSDLAAASVVVSGRTIDYRDESPSEERIVRRWLVEVDERYRGDTADVIEIVLDTELGDCTDTRVGLPLVLLLEPREPGGYELPACISAPHEWELEPFFDVVPPASGEGPAAAIAAATTGDHDLAVLNQTGEVVRYLPGTGVTLGLANCPGDDFFVQLRSASSVIGKNGSADLVRWRYSDLSIAEVVQLGGAVVGSTLPGVVVPMSCRNGDGTEVGIYSGPGTEYVDGVVGPREELLGSAVIVGAGERALDIEGSQFQVLSSWGALAENGVTSYVPLELPTEFAGRVINPPWDWSAYQSIRRHGDGWEVTLQSERAVVVVRIEPDGTTSMVDRVERPADVVGPVIVIDPGIRAALPTDRGDDPVPLFARSGVRLDAPSPTFPPDPAFAAATTRPSSDVTVAPAGSTIVGDDVADRVNGNDSTWARWVVGGMLALVVIGGIALIVRRSDVGRDEPPPPGGDS